MDRYKSMNIAHKELKNNERARNYRKVKFTPNLVTWLFENHICLEWVTDEHCCHGEDFCCWQECHSAWMSHDYKDDYELNKAIKKCTMYLVRKYSNINCYLWEVPRNEWCLSDNLCLTVPLRDKGKGFGQCNDEHYTFVTKENYEKYYK